MDSSENIVKEFKEHSISEFFKKNRQMLGYSSMIKSLVTVVHEYVTNSLDACEDAEILPNISVKLNRTGDNRYIVIISDNGPGIPKQIIGKALAMILAGTKFHRNVQQRGQQGIGAAGCTLFSQTTTGKPIRAISGLENGKAFSCSIGIDTMHNKPIINDVIDLKDIPRGLTIEGEFAMVKYDTSDHSVLEYLKRTALSNPHAQIVFIDPDGKEFSFLRSVDKIPEKPKAAKLHPLGLSVNDLLEEAHSSKEDMISTFLSNNFSRFSQGKVNELKELLPNIDISKKPKELQWNESEMIIDAFKKMKWISPETAHIIPIGHAQIELTLKNISNPEFMHVIERKPKVFKGGFPFIVEAAIAYGGSAGKQLEEGYTGNILRFANRVPLLFDSGNCAITEAVRSIQWKRYNIDMDMQPVSVFVNISSVHIPYSGVGKESVSQEEEIIEEIKLAVMDAARGLQHFIHNKEKLSMYANKYKTIMRYTGQLSKDLASLTGKKPDEIRSTLEKIVAKHYSLESSVNDNKTQSATEDNIEKETDLKEPSD